MRPRAPALAGAAAAAVLAVGAALAAGSGFRPVELAVRPIERFLPTSDQTRFGALEFRGGLELSAPTTEFAAFSGLDFAADGRLYAVSDRGRWLRAQPIVEGGRLTGLEDAVIAPILNHAGDPVVGKRWADAEGLRIAVRGGRETALVVFERSNDVRAFAGPDFPLSRSSDGPLPAGAAKMSGRDGAEAIAVAPDDGPLGGAMVVVAEVLRDAQGNIVAWIVGGPQAGGFSVLRRDGHDVADAVFLPGGDLLTLERRFGLPFGLSIRIRRIPGDALRPGATVDGPVIFEATLGHQIDNMEGIAVTEGPDGETLVALISDNNLSPLQRTLLLYFALVGERDSTATLPEPDGLLQ
ncbi:MAG: esterase-like activity of phytase family protein [Rhizobiales bacterium]|nr:esterase-like activity of phytase family protein [Hyphomicrobiales bacterium]